MNLLAIPILWRWAAAAAVLAGLALGYIAWAGHQRDIGRQEVRAEWAVERERQKDDALRRAAEAAKETQRRLTAQKEAQDAHDKELAAARADAGRAAGAAAGLRQQLAAFTAAARRPAGNPAAVGDGPPAGTALDLLADLFGRADESAGILAEALDRSHAAGRQCEREHDALSR